MSLLLPEGVREELEAEARRIAEQRAERLYAILADEEGYSLTRQEAEFLCDAPALPDLFQIRPFQPGPRREWESRIMVKDVSPETQIGRIIVPDTAQRKTGECIIVDLGRGAWDEEAKQWCPFEDIRVGDRVVIGKYVGQEIGIPTEVDGVRGMSHYRVMMLRDVMAKYDVVERW